MSHTRPVEEPQVVIWWCLSVELPASKDLGTVRVGQ